MGLLSCAAHTINLVLSHTFDEMSREFVYETIDETIENCAELVTYMKRSGLNVKYRIDENFKMLFTTYLRLHIEYCMQEVGPYTVQDVKTLEQVQRHARKQVKTISNLSYEECLQ